jgi:Ca2+:H+ antiporter
MRAILTLSRASAITLLVVYGIYLRFLLRPSRLQLVLGEVKGPYDRRRDSASTADVRSINRLSRTIRFADEHASDQESMKTDSTHQPSMEMEDMSTTEAMQISDDSDGESVQTEQSASRSKPLHKPHRPPAYSRSPSHTRSRSSSLTGLRRLRLSDIAERYGGSVSDLSSGQLLAPAFMDASLDEPSERSIDTRMTRIGRIPALILLVGSSMLVAVCADFLVQTIADITANSTLSESFLGLIVLPIAGNAAEYITAVTVAAKGKVDLAIGVSFGSSIQIALFVNPLMVILGWILRKDMSLYFGLFETATLIGVALLVNFLIWNGRTNCLEGSLLCACYVMIG